MFAAIEQAIKGSPAEFYHFQRGATHWYYTSADAAQVYNGNTYTPTKLKRSRIKQGGGMSAEGVTLTLPRNNEIALTYISFPAAANTSIIIYGRHRNDVDAEVVHIWSGRVKNANFKGAAVELFCESILTASRAQGLKRNFGANCSHVLYDQTPLTCGVNKASHAMTAAVSAVMGSVITSASFASNPSGYYSGGIIEWVNAGLTEYRMILEHSGANIRLVAPLHGMASGATVTVYPGCDRTTSQCAGRFNNLANYGGFPYVPTKTPFGGTMNF